MGKFEKLHGPGVAMSSSSRKRLFSMRDGITETETTAAAGGEYGAKGPGFGSNSRMQGAKATNYSERTCCYFQSWICGQPGGVLKKKKKKKKAFVETIQSTMIIGDSDNNLE